MTNPQNGDEKVAERLRGLPGELAPPPPLEPRVTARLAAAGLLRGSPSTPLVSWRRVSVAAAIALAFLGGWVGGGRSALPEPPHTRYVLLLYPGASLSDAADDVATYRRWAQDIRSKGRYVTGERLAPAAIESPTDGNSLEGYFVIDADSDQEAAAIARTHPHALAGGRIVVRRIEPT